MVDLTGWILPLILWAQSLSGPVAYLGVFVVSFIGSASIFLPLPSALLVVAFGGILNPFAVGIIAGAGAALGETIGYFVGLGGRKLAKDNKWLVRAEKWAEHYSAFIIITLFAATPLPDDITGILAGAIKYNIKKFVLASFIGKTILFTILALAGAYGIESLINILSVG